MRYERLALAIAIASATPFAALADAYENNCVMAVSKIVPPAAAVQRISTAPAPLDLVRHLGRVQTIRWVQVDATLSIGGRRIPQSYICSENSDGERVVVPTDRSGPGPTHDWTVR
jgi:hypothetical protein